MTRKITLLLTLALALPSCTIYFGGDDDDHPPWQQDAGWPEPGPDAGGPGPGCGDDAGVYPDAGWYPDAGYWPDAGYQEVDAGPCC